MTDRTLPMPTKVADSFKNLGIPEDAYPDLSKVPERFHVAIRKHYELMVVTEDVNGQDYEPDFTNMEEEKCIPVFIVDADEEHKTGFGLSYYGYVSTYASTYVGARLLCKDDDTAEYIGETFREEIFEPYMLKGK